MNIHHVKLHHSGIIDQFTSPSVWISFTMVDYREELSLYTGELASTLINKLDNINFEEQF